MYICVSVYLRTYAVAHSSTCIFINMHTCCQTPGLGLRLGVDFVFSLSQEQQQEQEPPPKSKLEFDTKDQVLFSNHFIFQFFQGLI